MTTQAVALFTYTNNYFFFGVRAPVFYVCVYKKKSRKTSDHCCSLGHYFWMCFLFLSLSSVHRCTSAVSNLFSFFFPFFRCASFSFFFYPHNCRIAWQSHTFSLFFCFRLIFVQVAFSTAVALPKNCLLTIFRLRKKKNYPYLTK